MRPLEGITVLDFSKVLAGPLCTQSLGELGAEVTKVESLGLGDETRGWPPFRAEGLGAVYLSVNRNKRSIAIDLKSEAGRKVAHELAKTADVVVESFGTGVAERLGIDAVTLQALNDKLVHCTISGYGRQGPMKDRPGYDVILQAFSGMMSLTGEVGGGYVRSPISPIDQVTGIHAVTGILAALMERSRTGVGSTVQVNLFETSLGLLRYNLQSFWERGVQPEKCGSTHESMCPYRVFEAADGALMLGVANDRLWRKFCSVAGLHHIVDDPRFRTNADRVANRAETDALVQSVIETQTVAHWDDTLFGVGVPCAPINGLKEVLDHPHTAASGMILEYDHPYAGPLKSVGLPITLDGERPGAGTPPPLHGQHTQMVLDELGYSAAQIDEMKSAGVIP